MLARPFATQCYSTPTSGVGNLEVVLQLRTGLQLTDELISRLRRPFTGLAKMAQWGGMAGDRYQPASSSMALRMDGTRLGARELQWVLDATNVDERAVFVIQNLVHFLHAYTAPVELLVIRAPSLRDSGDITEELPIDNAPHPFDVAYEPKSTTVMVDVEFRDREHASTAEPFREGWYGWYEVASHGGFSSEDYPVEDTQIFVEDDLKVTSTGIGGVFEHVVIDDAGFYCLINMLEALHHRLTPIDDVTIE